MRYRSKSQLLESIRTEHDGFLTVARSIPETRYLEEGVWGDAWTIKDLFAHLTEWEQMFLGWYRQGLRGEDPALPAPGYKWNQIPELNRAIWRKHKDKPWRRVREESEKSYAEILSLAEGLSEAQLLTAGHFRWTGKHPLASYLAPNSCSHYRTTTKILKRLLGRRRAALAPGAPPCDDASGGRAAPRAKHSKRAKRSRR